MTTDWITRTAAGEALGIAGVALAYSAAGRGLVPEAPAVLAAGAWEGLCLGGLQAAVLARAGISGLRWIGATVAVAVIGYAGSLVGGAGGAAEAAAEPPVALVLAAVVALGLGLGSLMGAVQVWAARGRLPFGAWVWRSAVGWAFAMPAIFAGSALVSEAWPLWSVVATGAVSGAAAGFLLGWATAPAVARLSA